MFYLNHPLNGKIKDSVDIRVLILNFMKCIRMPLIILTDFYFKRYTFK